MKRVKKYALLWLISLIISIIFTYPGIASIHTKIIGDHGDGWQNIWNINHINESINNKTNPYNTDKLHYPDKTELYLHTLSPALNGIGAIFFKISNNSILSYNLLVILILSINPLFIYAFLEKIGSKKYSQILATFIFSFSPYIMGHALGHINLIFIGIIPLILLTFINYSKKPIPKHYLFLTSALVLGFFSSLYYLAFSILLITCKALYSAIEKKSIKEIFSYILALTPFAIITAPIWIKTIQFAVKNELVVHNPERWSADILSFIIPSNITTIGQFFTEVTTNFTTSNAEGSLYLGLTVMSIAIYTIIKKPNKKTIIAGIGVIISLALALGMHLHINGHITQIPLPYNLLYKTTPLIEITGVPMRFTALAFLFLAIIISQFEISLPKTKKKIIALMIGSLVFVEFLPLPFKTYQHPQSTFYTELAKKSDNTAILDLHKNPTATLYYQTIHNKKIVGGYISKQTQAHEDYLKNDPIISPFWKFTDFYNPVSETIIKDITPEKIEKLKNLGISYIVFENTPHNKQIIEKLPLQKTFEDSSIIVFKL